MVNIARVLLSFTRLAVYTQPAKDTGCLLYATTTNKHVYEGEGGGGARVVAIQG